MAADATKPQLREAITVASELVTLGDLFTGAGDYAQVAVFRAPDLGKSGTVPADLVASSAQAAGMTDFDRGGIQLVSVTRAARQIAASEIADAIKSVIAGSLSTNASHIEIDFDRPPGLLYAHPASATPVAIERLAQSASGARFDAVVLIDQGTTAQQVRVSGTAAAVQEIVSAAREMSRGDIVAAEDLTVTRVPISRVQQGAATSIGDLVGLATRRSIRAGAALASRDFEPPNLVERGETVTIVYRGRGLMLTARGKSMNNGAKGAGISVVNITSGRILTATVVDRGTVEVTSNAPTGELALGNLK